MITGPQSFNGDELSRKYNQTIKWFLDSEYCISDKTIKVFYPFWTNRELLDLQIKDHQQDDRYVLNYCNESYIYTRGDARKAQQLFEYFVDKCQIPTEHLLFLGNIHEFSNQQTQFAHANGLADRMLLIDYYELQTYFFHELMEGKHGHNHQYRSDAPYDFKFMFGKTKPERVIMAHKLKTANMLSNSISSCILPPEHISLAAHETVYLYRDWLKKQVSISEVTDMLTNMAGSPDHTDYVCFLDKDGKPSNHCPGWPYDHTLFSDTKISIIPETFYFKNHACFVTEKTFKAIYNHHPFVIMGTPGILKRLRNRGYRTFGALCDEMYDVCGNDIRRMNMVITAAHQLLNCNDHAQLAEITAHNHACLVRNAHTTMQQLNQHIEKFLS